MGMFDSTYVGFACPACGMLPNEPVEVQFKIYVGRRYEPSCRVVELGESLAGFPKIPVYLDQGIYCCRACKALPDVDLRFEHGVLVTVGPSDEDSGWGELPQPRSIRKRQQREALGEELARRGRYTHLEMAARLGSAWDNASLAAALAQPLMQRLDYTKLGRAMLLVEPLPQKRIGPYAKELYGKWKRTHDL